MGKSAINAVLGFLAGAAAGAITGILYAPDKGTRTRKNITKKARKANADFRTSLNSSVKDLKEYVTEFVEDVKGRFENLEAQVEEQTEKAEKAAQKAAAAAEKKSAKAGG